MNEHVKQKGHTGYVLEFPGRWIGGIQAVQPHPKLMVASYSFFAAGNLLKRPAIIILAGLIGTRNPGWGLWGGVFAVFGLFAHTFHSNFTPACSHPELLAVLLRRKA